MCLVVIFQKYLPTIKSVIINMVMEAGFTDKILPLLEQNSAEAHVDKTVNSDVVLKNIADSDDVSWNR